MRRELKSFAVVAGKPGESVIVEFIWEITGFFDDDVAPRTFIGRGTFESAAAAETYARERGWS